MTETKKVFKWWWPWQPEVIEDFLEGMAAQGWVLVYVRSAATSFVFEKRQPVKMRYCVDYQEKDKPEYRTLLSDAGWRFEYAASGWFIWSMAYDGERPAIYTDTDSLVRRNRAILGSLSAVFAALIPLWVVNLNSIGEKGPVAAVMLGFWAIIMAIYVGIIIGMALGIHRLKKKGKQN
jgi:hypothetical protein